MIILIWTTNNVFRDHEPLIAPAPKPVMTERISIIRKRNLSFTKVEEVYKRALQAAKKGEDADVSLERRLSDA